MTDILTDKVYRFAMKEQLLARGDTVIAGVSGGADSICLFFILLEIAGEMDLHLQAVHVNHGIRGEEADDDEAFVRQICSRQGVPLRVFSGDVPGMARKWHMTLEEAGRRYRYACLEEAAGEIETARIAVAHHLNDQCETVLMNLLRGTGLKGMGGMPVKRGRIIRPLLCADRDEIEAYLQRHGLKYCMDRTNMDTDLTRNRVRLELIPYLEDHFNSGTVRHITALADSLRDVSSYLEREAAKAAQAVLAEEKGKVCISRADFLQLDTALQRELLMLALEKAAGERRDLGFVHIEKLRALFHAPAGKRISLPYRITAVNEYESIVLKEDPADAVTAPAECSKVPVPGICRGIRFDLMENAEGLSRMAVIPKNRCTKWFDYDRIYTELVLRTRRQGDYMVIRPDKEKSLGRILIDDKVPRDKRDSLLLLADGSHILWIPALGRISEAVKVTEQTEHILTAQILPGQDEIKSGGSLS